MLDLRQRRSFRLNQKPDISYKTLIRLTVILLSPNRTAPTGDPRFKVCAIPPHHAAQSDRPGQLPRVRQPVDAANRAVEHLGHPINPEKIHLSTFHSVFGCIHLRSSFYFEPATMTSTGD